MDVTMTMKEYTELKGFHDRYFQVRDESSDYKIALRVVLSYFDTIDQKANIATHASKKLIGNNEILQLIVHELNENYENLYLKELGWCAE